MNDKKRKGIKEDLLLEFFSDFARIEYALKNSGFVKGDERRVSADWDSFSKSINSLFRKDRTAELKEASDYLLNNPPNKQVLRLNNLMWEANVPNGSLSELEKLILLIRRTRNNLFHGGKHNIGIFEDIQRGTQLLRSSLIIIQ